MARYLLLFVFAFCLTACKDPKKEQISEAVHAFIGKQLVVPVDSLQARIMGKDTVCTDMLAPQTKILVYVDSSGCSPCKMELAAWSLRLEEIDTMHSRPVLLFMIDTPNMREIDMGLRAQGFEYPVFYDLEHQMGLLNPNLTKTRFNTFLLDKENRVVLVGSPANNDKLWELYKQQIRKLMDKD